MKNFLPLIEQAKKGDEQAMEILLKDFKPLLIKEASNKVIWMRIVFKI